MANVSRKGFWPLKHSNGSPWNGAVNTYVILTGMDTAIGVGDLVKLGTTGGVTNPAYHSVLHFGAATSDVVLGVVVGFGPDANYSRFIPNSNRWTDQTGERIVYVMDDPDVLLVGQSDTAVPVASYGLDAPVAAATPSTTTGFSAQVIGTPAALATSPLKIMGSLNSPDNEINAASNKLIVKMNSHAYQAGVLGV
jgi:hypothetical protein